MTHSNSKYTSIGRFSADLPIVSVINGNFEAALRLFRKKVADSGVFRQLRGLQLFPSRAARKAEKKRRSRQRALAAAKGKRFRIGKPTGRRF